MRNLKSTLLYNWFEDVWNKDDENAIDRLMTDEAEFHGIDSNNGTKGAADFKLFFRDFSKQFKNIRIDVEEVISQDDMEAARTVIHAIEADTNKPILFSGICMVRVEDGKIAEAWNSYDFLSVHLQLGKRLVAD
ncbi:ester cyclase [Dyadobacter sp. NIV53]|uniref:ester cyclase n=1 Tax=Dyadobacter sp. NIV53 TaxID=2861765 RepID=UPI001C87E093|nr:ester cyclase [Dyadobacter sp. NIV53]